jgi:hypothetical protein
VWVFGGRFQQKKRRVFWWNKTCSYLKHQTKIFIFWKRGIVWWKANVHTRNHQQKYSSFSRGSEKWVGGGRRRASFFMGVDLSGVCGWQNTYLSLGVGVGQFLFFLIQQQACFHRETKPIYFLFWGRG